MASPLLRETCSASFSGARPCCLYSSQRGERPEALIFGGSRWVEDLGSLLALPSHSEQKGESNIRGGAAFHTFPIGSIRFDNLHPANTSTFF